MIILAILALAVSCQEDLRDAEALGENEGIIGTWVEEGYDQDVTLLERASGLDPSSYGFIIGGDGSFTERKKMPDGAERPQSPMTISRAAGRHFQIAFWRLPWDIGEAP